MGILEPLEDGIINLIHNIINDLEALIIMMGELRDENNKSNSDTKTQQQ